MIDLPVIYHPNYNEDWEPLKYAKRGDAGFDLRAAMEETVLASPGHVYTIPTGVSFAIPKGHELQIRPRSGLAAKGLTITNAPGTIDSGYRGEVQILMHVVANRVIPISPGDRIAQAVLAPVTRANLVDTDDIDDIADHCDRGVAGIGSTGLA